MTAVLRFPSERCRPAITRREHDLRDALSTAACDQGANLNTRIRATQRLLERPNMRETERDIWRDLLDQLKTRARQNARAMVDAGQDQDVTPDGAA